VASLIGRHPAHPNHDITLGERRLWPSAIDCAMFTARQWIAATPTQAARTARNPFISESRPYRLACHLRSGGSVPPISCFLSSSNGIGGIGQSCEYGAGRGAMRNILFCRDIFCMPILSGSELCRSHCYALVPFAV